MRPNPLFAFWPYVALCALLAGGAARLWLARHRMASVAAQLASAQAAARTALAWRVSLALLAAGHVAGLLFPAGVLAWNASPARLYTLEGIAFAVGVVALAGWALRMWRPLGWAAASPWGELADVVFLSVLFVGISSGLWTAIAYRWGSLWGAVTLAPYVRSLATGHPETRFITEMPFAVQLHAFSGFAALVVLPFTRLALPGLVAVHRALGFASRTVSAWSAEAEAWLRKRSPGPWIWPDED
jgi:nitrate reductase gamma subunit